MSFSFFKRPKRKCIFNDQLQSEYLFILKLLKVPFCALLKYFKVKLLLRKLATTLGTWAYQCVVHNHILFVKVGEKFLIKILLDVNQNGINHLQRFQI